MSALSPGLYRAKVRGIPGESIVMAGERPSGPVMYALGPESSRVRECYNVVDARPLIILDLEDPAETVRHMRSESAPWDEIELIAGQIEAQTKPARIPEPGWGEKVTASIKHSPDRWRWVAVKDGPSQWWHSETGHRYAWDELIDPTLIREGKS